MTEDERAEIAIQFHTDLALLRHRQQHANDQDCPSHEHCEECGNEIPEARRKALPGVTLCIGCKQTDEHKDRMIYDH